MIPQGLLRESVVCITGASSGIGASCARACAAEGASLLVFARRKDRLHQLASELADKHSTRCYTAMLDVRDRNQVEQVFDALPEEWRRINILINNAGLARGMHKLHEGDVQDWEEMIDTNVKGLLYVSRKVVPWMVTRGSGHVVNIGSIAGFQVYPNGNVYCASKHAVKALTEGLRMDLLGTGVRVSSVSPGLVETEFSIVRFHGDEQRAGQTYQNMQPLSADDIADSVLYCITRPAHVGIADIVIMPTAQASVHHVHRSIPTAR
jgi:3-hydroxy acid dehydrogenase / malonic semialdehyde reductase